MTNAMGAFKYDGSLKWCYNTIQNVKSWLIVLLLPLTIALLGRILLKFKNQIHFNMIDESMVCGWVNDMCKLM